VATRSASRPIVACSASTAIPTRTAPSPATGWPGRASAPSPCATTVSLGRPAPWFTSHDTITDNGNDTIDVREFRPDDEPDKVDCGPGTDTVFVDPANTRFNREIFNPNQAI
jgi:hypothetical protein